jgi:uncharacterized protein
MRVNRRLKVVIPGGSGHVGTLLATHFHNRGDSVVALSRRPYFAPWRVVTWDGQSLGDWVDELEGADVAINLAGRSVNCRYNSRNRREIIDSRVLPTRGIAEALCRLSNPPSLWMNASTATIYRHSLNRPMDDITGEIGGNEPGVPGSWKFSIEVATSWEAAFFDMQLPGVRQIALRSAIILNPQRGSIFDVLLGLVRHGLGGTVGTGEQFVSWVHEADFVASLDFLIANKQLSGCVNIASPNPLPNREFMWLLRQAWGTKLGLPAPEWLLEIGTFFLRTESELVLKSRRVVPRRLLDAGFQFKFPQWSVAARDLVDRWRQLQGQQTYALAAEAVSKTR